MSNVPGYSSRATAYEPRLVKTSRAKSHTYSHETCDFSYAITRVLDGREQPDILHDRPRTAGGATETSRAVFAR
jgi:hypothetical protein